MNPAFDDAVHAQPLPAVTPIDAVLPVPARLSDVLDSVYVQVVVGAVGVVVEVRSLEHAPVPIAAIIAATHSSLRTIPPGIEGS